MNRDRLNTPGRGRHATAPWEIPWAGWTDILWQTYQQIGEHRVLAVAAGVLFYGLLAMIQELRLRVNGRYPFCRGASVRIGCGTATMGS
jgi:membrane protein